MFTRNSIVLSNSIKTPLTAISKAIGSNGILKYSYNFDEIIRQIFSHQEQGFAYDPNDLTTMYRDAAGTLPVTGVGQPVGLILDKSKGLVIGSELVSAENSTFTAGTGDWVAFNSSISVVDGTLLVDASAVNGGTSLAMIGLKVGQAYVISCDARAGTSSAAQITLDYNGIVYTTKHDFTKITGVFFATRADASVKLISGTAGTFYIDNVSVKELSGNHAYQTTSASRPILRKNAVTSAYYLEFDGSDDFLQTNNISFTATDKVSLFAGVRKLSDASVASLIKLGAAIEAGRFEMLLPPAAGLSRIELSTDSAWAQFNIGTSPKSLIFTGAIDRSLGGSALGDMKARIDGVDSANIANSNTDPSGKFGNLPLFIGRRGGTSLPFTGHIYGIIGIGKLVSDTETTAIEKELAKRVGVTISV